MLVHHLEKFLNPLSLLDETLVYSDKYLDQLLGRFALRWWNHHDLENNRLQIGRDSNLILAIEFKHLGSVGLPLSPHDYLLEDFIQCAFCL